MYTTNYRDLLLFKGLRKKLNAIAKLKDCEIVGEWTQSIVNHLYWCAMSSSDSSSNEEMIRSKWLSLSNHIHNKHTHKGIFKKCAHKSLNQNRRKKKWFKLGIYYMFSTNKYNVLKY